MTPTLSYIIIGSFAFFLLSLHFKPWQFISKKEISKEMKRRKNNQILDLSKLFFFNFVFAFALLFFFRSISTAIADLFDIQQVVLENLIIGVGLIFAVLAFLRLASLLSRFLYKSIVMPQIYNSELGKEYKYFTSRMENISLQNPRITFKEYYSRYSLETQVILTFLEKRKHGFYSETWAVVIFFLVAIFFTIFGLSDIDIFTDYKEVSTPIMLITLAFIIVGVLFHLNKLVSSYKEAKSITYEDCIYEHYYFNTIKSIEEGDKEQAKYNLFMLKEAVNYERDTIKIDFGEMPRGVSNNTAKVSINELQQEILNMK